MSGRLAGLSDLLVPDETGRRALEETLADWREERARARSMPAGLFVDARAFVSFLRVFAATAWRDAWRPDVWRLFAWMLAGAALLAVPQAASYIFRVGTDVAPADAVALTIILLPGGLATLVPLMASLGLGTRRHRPVPILAAACVCVVFLTVMTGWVVPAANQVSRERIWVVTATRSGVPPARGLAELSAPELLQKVVRGRPHERWNALQAVSGRAAMVVSGPTLLLLGMAIRNRFGRRRWRVAQVAGPLAAVFLFFLGSAVAAVPLFRWPVAERLDRLAIDFWMALGLAWVVTAVLSRTRNVGTRNQTSEP